MINTGAVAASAAVKRRREQQNNNVKVPHIDYYNGFCIKIQQGFFRKVIGYVYAINKNTITYRKTTDYTKKKVWYHVCERNECFDLCRALNEKYRGQNLHFDIDSVEVKEYVSYDANGKEQIKVVHWWEG